MKQEFLSPDEQKKLTNRLSRIEGQVRGIQKMVEEKSECVNIVTQIIAVREAISMLGVEIIQNDFECQQKNKKKIKGEYLKALFRLK